MAAEFRREVPKMYNLSENIEENGKKGIREERIEAIDRMIKDNAAKEQIILYGYTEAEYIEAEKFMYMNT